MPATSLLILRNDISYVHYNSLAIYDSTPFLHALKGLSTWRERACNPAYASRDGEILKINPHMPQYGGFPIICTWISLAKDLLQLTSVSGYWRCAPSTPIICVARSISRTARHMTVRFIFSNDQHFTVSTT